MTAKINTNGQARKSLAEQIDRLDGMLDGLSDGLNEAVADAVKDAVGAAVHQAAQAVLREVLTSPEMMARLRSAAPAAPAGPTGPTVPAVPAAPAVPAPPPAPPLSVPKVSGKQPWASVRQGLAACVEKAGMECGRRLEQARRCAVGAWDCVRGLGRFWKPMLTVVGVGVTVGVVACLARPWLAVAVNVAIGFAAKASVQVRTAWQQVTTLAMASMG